MSPTDSKDEPARAVTGWAPVFAVLWAAAIAAGAQVTVPMQPVPMTLQTLAVLLAGGISGGAAGALAGVLYATAVVLGAPILSDASAAPGAAFLDLRSAGYVIGFIPAAWVASLGAGRPARSLFRAMVGAHAVVLACGAAWLARHIGVSDAWAYGVRPFLLGAVVKSAVAMGIVLVLRRRLSADPVV